VDPDGIGSLLEEVVRRANRLSEWAQLEPELRKVQESFRAFLDLLRSNIAENQQFKTAEAVPKLQNDWIDRHTSVLDELNAFGTQLSYIHEPLQGGVRVDGRTSIKAILDAGDVIKRILIVEISSVRLSEASRAFQSTVNTHMANRQICFRKEVNQLCELANRLRSLLNQRPTTPPPSAGAGARATN
jgi:hypothetical protein